MAIILKATLSVPVDKNLAAIEAVSKMIAATIDEIEAITGKGTVEYAVDLANKHKRAVK
jgi:hypothetical protein